MRDYCKTDRVYYVRNDGKDTNNGWNDTKDSAFGTLQGGIEALRNGLDFGGKNIVLQAGAGTYAGVRLADQIPFTGGVLHVRGDESTPSNCLISPSSPTQA